MDLDFTLFAQLAILLFLLIVLGNALFKPMLAVIELRDKSIAGAREEGAKLTAEAMQKDAELQASLDAFKRKAMAERQKLLGEGRERERQIIEAARQAAAQKIEAARKDLQVGQKRASENLKNMTQDLARSVAGKILSRDVA